MKTTSGILLDKYPYARQGHSTKYVIIFPPTGDLIRSVATNPDRQIRKYRKFFPNQYSILILGYPVNMDERGSASEIIAADFGKIIHQKLFDDNFMEPAIITGISYGGKIAIPFVARFPELVEKLLILMSAHELSTQGITFCNDCVDLAEAHKHLQLLLKFNQLYASKLLKHLMNFLTRAGWFFIRRHLNQGATLGNAYKYMLAHNKDTQNYLRKIEAPSLIIGAEQDLLFTQEAYEETAARIPRGKVHVVKGGGHIALIENYKECARVVRGFL